MTDASAASIRTLVDGCRSRFDAELCELIEELGPKLVEEVRGLSVSTHDADRRTVCINLHVELPARWKKLVAALRDGLGRRAEPTAKRGPDYTAVESLHILSDDEDAVQLAIRELNDRVAGACGEETGALERRIAHLVLRNALPGNDGAFRVATVTGCLVNACTEAFPDAAQRLVLLPLLAEPLADELPQIYRSTNETLIDADVLPALKRSYVDAPPPVDPATAAAESARMMSALERLTKARADVAGTAAPAGDAGASTQAFLGSLQTLKEMPTTSASGTHTNLVRMARDSEAARNVRPLEAVTLDIVAEVFDLIFGDEHVSEGIKALVGRLQTPVLKVAMLNQRFFADRSHPARRFLDGISAVAVRWGKVVDASDPFYRKLAELVERIAHTYDGDTAVFDAANAELAEFLAERERIEVEANKALAESVAAREEAMRQQREAQVRAQKMADDAVTPLLGPDLPVAIEQFLLGYWRDVVQGRIVVAGAESPVYADALQAAKDLLWSVTPKHTAADRQRQAAELPALLKRLNAGLDEVGASAAERTAFMDTLVELSLSALRAESRAAKKPDGAPARKPLPAKAHKTLQVTHATDRGVRVQDISLPKDAGAGPEDAPDKADLRRVRQLVRGDWVEFISVVQTRRERLTWINPSRSLLLFSNSASECAITITPEALAARLTNQTARIVKRDAPIFERALNGAVRSLDKAAAGARVH